MTDSYAPQMLLPEVGRDGQEKLSRASILIVGAGGLGCPVEEAPLLVVAGAKRINPAAIGQLTEVETGGHRVVLCCRSGVRAWHGARKLQSQGLHNIALAALGA